MTLHMHDCVEIVGSRFAGMTGKITERLDPDPAGAHRMFWVALDNGQRVLARRANLKAVTR